MRNILSTIAILALPAAALAQAGNVGINTPNPLVTFHVDGGKDDPQTGNTLDEPQILNDAGITSEGYFGVGISPLVQLQLQRRSTSGTQNEGIILPKLSRARAQSIAAAEADNGLKEGTIIYVNDITNGTQTGSAIDMNITGFFWWDSTQKVWHRLIKNEDVDGISASKYNYTSTSGVDNNVVRCGKFLLRINSSNHPQMMLQPGVSNFTGYFGFEQRWPNNNYSFTNVSKNWSNSTFVDIDNTTIDNGELNILYFNYPGDNLFKKVTFLRMSNAPSTGSTFIISCEIE